MGFPSRILLSAPPARSVQGPVACPRSTGAAIACTALHAAIGFASGPEPCLSALQPWGFAAMVQCFATAGDAVLQRRPSSTRLSSAWEGGGVVVFLVNEAFPDDLFAFCCAELVLALLTPASQQHRWCYSESNPGNKRELWPTRARLELGAVAKC